MKNVDVARAWRDPKYRRSLGARAAELPESPAGKIELTDEELRVAGGLRGGPIKTTAVNCTLYSFLGWKACGCGGPVTTAINCTLFSFQGWKSCGCP